MQRKQRVVAETTKAKSIRYRVKATEAGYDGIRRRAKGDKFFFTIAKGAKLGSWMKVIDQHDDFDVDEAEEVEDFVGGEGEGEGDERDSDTDVI